jgi:hypothetical protein
VEKTNSYFIFYDRILSCIVSNTYWLKAVPGRLATEVVTASDEALPLLILQNNWSCWKQIASIKLGEWLEGVSKVMMKWMSKAMSAGKYEGWGSEGILFYNNMCTEMKGDKRKCTV